MKRLTLAFLLGSVFTVGCGQRLVDLPGGGDDDNNNENPPLPVLTSILPQRGPEAGGTSVVLKGTNLSGTTEVAFGSTTATFTVNSSTQVTATSPAGTTSVNVTVLTPGGRSNGLPFGYGNAPLVTGVSPASGSSAGGQTVTVTGSAFTGTTSVTFGGTAVTSFTVSSDSSITVVTPAHAAGTVAVVVTTNVAASNDFDFNYGEAPGLVSIAPANGPTTGGTVVTLTGTHLTGATAVTFGTTPGTAIAVVDDSHVTVTAPAHAVGNVSVTVTTPFGTSTGVTFTYGLAPTLASASPDSSPVIGGASIVLTGTNLTAATAVSFGSTPATSFNVDSDTQITAVSPASTDSVNITVTTPVGTSNGLPFGYGNAPVETSLNPNIGLVTGGTSVVITGTKFTGATGVSFGADPATSFNVDSDTQITAVAPAHAAGTAQVVTTTPSGSSNDLTFTYGAAPTLVSALPVIGTTAGGTSVVLTGTDFTGATAVTFGATPAASFTVDSATQITAVSPAGAVGATSITVTNAFGASNGVTFTYGDVPAITSLNPATGDETGGTSVVITGTGLDNATAVLFGAVPATSFTLDSATQITAVSPAGVGSVNVTVTTPFGTSNGVAFAYGTSPTITSLAPSTGTTLGGNTVTINGTNFTAASTVLFASSLITPPAVTFVSATQLTVTAPAHTVGPVDVTVTTEDGTTNAATYTYGVAPDISDVDPSAGAVTGGTFVTITGTDFTGTTSVTFDGLTATNVVVVNSTTVNVTAPAHAAGPVDVLLTTPFGTATSAGSFTYVDPPTLTTVNPNTGPAGGGTTVTLTGTNLSTATLVTFGGTPATNLIVVDDTTITVSAPAHSAVAVDVTVTTPAGSATSAGGYTYITGTLAVTSLTPTSGVSTGGTLVTISGAGFTGATAVTFDGAAAAIVEIVDDGTLSVTTPAGTLGAVDVVVTTPAGSATLTGGYTYVLAVTPGIITGSSNFPGVLTGTGLAWLGTAPEAYRVFSCAGAACNINDVISPATGPITDTAFTAGPGTWSGFTGAICPATSTTWDALVCTNQFFSP